MEWKASWWEVGLCICNLPTLVKTIQLLHWACSVSHVGGHLGTVNAKQGSFSVK